MIGGMIYSLIYCCCCIDMLYLLNMLVSNVKAFI